LDETGITMGLSDDLLADLCGDIRECRLELIDVLYRFCAWCCHLLPPVIVQLNSILKPCGYDVKSLGDRHHLLAPKLRSRAGRVLPVGANPSRRSCVRLWSLA
jgi:hypothetical protein